MKIRIKHKETEIEVDETHHETHIKHSFDAIIKLLEKISQELQAIENNYNKTTYQDE
jgi:hypothetical protein